MIEMEYKFNETMTRPSDAIPYHTFIDNDGREWCWLALSMESVSTACRIPRGQDERLPGRWWCRPK
jgi:hypothetical protein